MAERGSGRGRCRGRGGTMDQAAQDMREVLQGISEIPYQSYEKSTNRRKQNNQPHRSSSSMMDLSCQDFQPSFRQHHRGPHRGGGTRQYNANPRPAHPPYHDQKYQYQQHNTQQPYSLYSSGQNQEYGEGNQSQSFQNQQYNTREQNFDYQDPYQYQDNCGSNQFGSGDDRRSFRKNQRPFNQQRAYQNQRFQYDCRLQQDRMQPKFPYRRGFRLPAYPGDERESTHGQQYPRHHYDRGMRGDGSSAKFFKDLVGVLARCTKQCAQLCELSRLLQTDPDQVENAVLSRQDIFYCKEGSGKVVELLPAVRLCSDYVSDKGCRSLDTCTFLHICNTYITGWCSEDHESCQFGHWFATGHNRSILSQFFLDDIEPSILKYVIRKACKGEVGSLKLCSFYNTQKGCFKGNTCGFLHICKIFLVNKGQCKNTNCTLKHDFKDCKTLLSGYGISTNESTRDIVLSLQDILQLPDDKTSLAPGQEEPEDNTKAKAKQKNRNRSGRGKVDGKNEDTASEASVDMDPSTQHQDKTSATHRQPDTSVCFYRSTDFHGDIAIPAMCKNGFEKCKSERASCKYLHANSPYHWQVGKDGTWFNFTVVFSINLEKSYTDVSKDDVTLPVLAQNDITNWNKKMFQILGCSQWKASFSNMTLCDSGNTRLKIRRISTASSAVSSHHMATVYEWYFKDEGGQWTAYGTSDSLNRQDLVVSSTSEDIEKQYQTDQSSSMEIVNASFKYRLDFTQMTQTNLTTGKVREIRRRPLRPPKKGERRKADSSSSSQPSSSQPSSNLPSHWSPMKANDTYVLVPLDPGLEEHQEVASRLRLTLPTATIVKIQRLQNKHLWCKLQITKDDLLRKYDDYKMNMQKLFHGTTSSMVDTICILNMDGRLYRSHTQDWGCGTYFFNSAATAKKFCTADSMGHFFMVLADVIIGSIVMGNNTMKRPPSNNPVTGGLYDTTVDDVHAPTVFVKYDTGEYCPHYIIEFQ